MQNPVDLLRALIADPKSFIEKLAKKPSVILMAANVAVQVITLGFAPVLSRLYAPEAFGVVGAINALVLVVAPLTTLRFEYGISRSSSESESTSLLQLCVRVGLITTPLLTLLTWAVASTQTAVEHLLPWLYLVPSIAFAMATYESLAMEASRKGLMRQLARSRIVQAVSGLAAQLTFGVLTEGPIGLVVGLVLNLCAGAVNLGRSLFRLNGLTRTPTAELITVARKHIDYAKFASWSSVLDMASRWSLQIALTLFWDAKSGGFLYLAERVVGRPLVVMSTALYPVYVSRFSSELTLPAPNLRAIFHSVLLRQGIVTLTWVSGIVALSPFLIGPVFGEEWAPAVPYIQLASLILAPGATLYPVSLTPQMTGRQRVEALIVVLRVVLAFGALSICAWLGETALTTLMWFAFTQFFVGIVRYACYLRIVTTWSSQLIVDERNQ